MLHPDLQEPSLYRQLLAWAFVITNATRVLTYIPMIRKLLAPGCRADGQSQLTWVLWSLSNATLTLQLFEQNGRRIDATVACCMANLVMNLFVLVLIRHAQHRTGRNPQAGRERRAGRHWSRRRTAQLVAIALLSALVEDAGADKRVPTAFVTYTQLAPRMMRVVARDDSGRVGLGSGHGASAGGLFNTRGEVGILAFRAWAG